jgi:hypothetical protein
VLGATLKLLLYVQLLNPAVFAVQTETLSEFPNSPAYLAAKIPFAATGVMPTSYESSFFIKIAEDPVVAFNAFAPIDLTTCKFVPYAKKFAAQKNETAEFACCEFAEGLPN